MDIKLDGKDSKRWEKKQAPAYEVETSTEPAIGKAGASIRRIVDKKDKKEPIMFIV